MNVLNRLTIKNLKLNRKRTIVTIVGIVLATALLVAVTTIADKYEREPYCQTEAERGRLSFYAVCGTG